MKNINLKDKFQQLRFFVIDSIGAIRSIFIYLFQNIKNPGIFNGYYSYYWACKYAKKRTNNWFHKWDQSGKQQAVLPLTEDKLIVCSKMELKFYQKRGVINKKLKPKKAIKRSYYSTNI